MEKHKYIYYEDDGVFVGFLQDFPDYRTQGKTLDELTDNLKDIYLDLNSGVIPHVLHEGVLEFA
ncbi:MAG: type II toxin-antitoxin system HicB family antitoxin [Candidatus Sabulitectum sp.]|nr:type II toxin-antitoxin system HicB family antitoxin [Candidatus Sabulitectum sp.]